MHPLFSLPQLGRGMSSIAHFSSRHALVVGGDGRQYSGLLCDQFTACPVFLSDIDGEEVCQPVECFHTPTCPDPDRRNRGSLSPAGIIP